MRVALVVHEITADLERNRAKLLRRARDAARGGAYLVLFLFARCFADGSHDHERWEREECPSYAERVRLLGRPVLMVNSLSDRTLMGGTFGGATVVAGDGALVACGAALWFGHHSEELCSPEIGSTGGKMTELLYQTDSYLKEFSAIVTAVHGSGKGIALDRTAFYPGGGGQPHDVGELRVRGVVLPVEQVGREGGEIWHYLAGDAPSVGSTVMGRLDWGLRYDLMRTHTAMHILCGVIWRDYCAQVTGGNMAPLRGRMDFEFENLRQEMVQEIEEKVNIEVREAREVRVALLPREQAFQIPDLIRTKINLLPEGISQVRVVEIVGLDLQADGGTHVLNTREAGRIRVVDYRSKGRINKRIEIALDE